MVTLNKKQFQQIERQALRQNTVRRSLKSNIEKKFKRIQQKFLKAFDEHPVTVELMNGPTSSNISRTLDGVGNLYSYIGFSAGTDPIRPLRKILEKYRIDYHPHEFKIKIDIILPTKEEVFAATPLPWASGRSWIKGIERGMSGVGEFLYRRRGIVKSKSGYAIQTRGKIRRSRFRNVSYISSLLNEYYKEIKNLEKQVF